MQVQVETDLPVHLSVVELLLVVEMQPLCEVAVRDVFVRRKGLGVVQVLV